MLCGAESSTITRVKSGRKKFRELLPLLTTKSVSLKVKGELYAACVCSVMLYGSLRWFGHSERRGLQICTVNGHIGCYKPRKTWEHVIMEDLRAKVIVQSRTV